MNEEKVLLHMGASLRSIILKSVIPMAVLLLLIGAAIELYLIYITEFSLRRLIIDSLISLVVVLVLSYIAARHILKHTYVRIYDDHVEISDVGRSYVRLTRLKYESIKKVSVNNGTLYVKANEKLKILHLADPYEMEKQIESRRKAHQVTDS